MATAQAGGRPTASYLRSRRHGFHHPVLLKSVGSRRQPTAADDHPYGCLPAEPGRPLAGNHGRAACTTALPVPSRPLSPASPPVRRPARPRPRALTRLRDATVSPPPAVAATRPLAAAARRVRCGPPHPRYHWPRAATLSPDGCHQRSAAFSCVAAVPQAAARAGWRRPSSGWRHATTGGRGYAGTPPPTPHKKKRHRLVQYTTTPLRRHCASSPTLPAVAAQKKRAGVAAGALSRQGTSLERPAAAAPGGCRGHPAMAVHVPQAAGHPTHTALARTPPTHRPGQRAGF